MVMYANLGRGLKEKVCSFQNRSKPYVVVEFKGVKRVFLLGDVQSFEGWGGYH